MDRKRAWMVPAFCGAAMIVIFFTSQGGLAGLAREPEVSFAVFAILVLISAPMLWLNYRRMRRDPILVPVAPSEPATPADVRLKNPPIILIASRWKTAARCVQIVIISVLFIAVSLAQPGVCRLVSLVSYGPVVLWSFAVSVMGLWLPQRLELRPEGLTHVWLWRERNWTWNELRDLTLVKSQIPIFGWIFKNRPTSGLYFKRYQPEGHAFGAARAGFSSVWRESGQEVSKLLEAARIKWSTPAGNAFVPVPMRFRSYLWTGAVLAIMAGVVWMWMAQPCAN